MTRELRITAIHRHYWPDTPPYASLLRQMVVHWVGEGHSVEVLTAQPSYKPELRQGREPGVSYLDGALVRRIPVWRGRGRLRALANAAVFPIAIAFRLLFGRRPDVVMCSTAPPVVLAAVTRWAAHRRGARFVYHCMDLHPEIGAISGEFGNPLVYRCLLWLDTATCLRADAIVVLSRDMRTSLLRRDPRLSSNVFVINNFELPNATDNTRQTELPDVATDRLRILFAGNLGRFQGLEELVAAVAAADCDCELLLMGEGSARKELERLVQRISAQERVRFVDHGSVSAARAMMRSADVGVVTLRHGVIRYAFPSKTMTYLAEGLPVLACVEHDSYLAQFLDREKAGLSCGPGDADALARVIENLAEETMLRSAWRDRARAASAHFDTASILDAWDGLLVQIDRKA